MAAMRMTVADLMTKNLVRVSPQCSADDALHLLSQHEATELYVTDTQGRLLGVLPDYEVVRVHLSGEADEATVTEFMSRSVPVFKPEADAAEVTRLFRDARFNRFPVVSNGRLVGVIGRDDIIRLMSVLCRMKTPAKSTPTSVKPPKLVSTRVRSKRAQTLAKKPVSKRTATRSMSSRRSTTSARTAKH
jgi:CBS domain-containing protein